MAFHQGFNFAATSLQAKYAWVVGKPGSTAVADAAAALRTADAELRSASDEARKRMAELGISWQGPAAAAAGRPRAPALLIPPCVCFAGVLLVPASTLLTRARRR